jgi:hypothetical protein
MLYKGDTMKKRRLFSFLIYQELYDFIKKDSKKKLMNMSTYINQMILENKNKK